MTSLPPNPSNADPNAFTCVQCRYSLLGLADDKNCPECGVPIAISAQKYHQDARRRRSRLQLLFWLAIICILKCALFPLIPWFYPSEWDVYVTAALLFSEICCLLPAINMLSQGLTSGKNTDTINNPAWERLCCYGFLFTIVASVLATPFVSTHNRVFGHGILILLLAFRSGLWCFAIQSVAQHTTPPARIFMRLAQWVTVLSFFFVAYGMHYEHSIGRSLALTSVAYFNFLLSLEFLGSLFMLVGAWSAAPDKKLFLDRSLPIS